MKPPKNIIYILVILLGMLLFWKICLHKKSENGGQSPNKNEYVIPEKKWTKPLLSIKGITEEPPVRKKELPIPRKDVAKTITVETGIGDGTGLDSKKFTIVLDKEGNVYRTKDFPDDVKIEVVRWRPPVFAIGMDYGFSLAYAGKTYFCLSVNVFNIAERVYFGGDLGIDIGDEGLNEWLLGIAARYKVWKRALVFISGGWDLIGKGVYVGISIMW